MRRSPAGLLSGIVLTSALVNLVFLGLLEIIPQLAHTVDLGRSSSMASGVQTMYGTSDALVG